MQSRLAGKRPRFAHFQKHSRFCTPRTSFLNLLRKYATGDKFRLGGFPTHLLLVHGLSLHVGARPYASNALDLVLTYLLHQWQLTLLCCLLAPNTRYVVLHNCVAACVLQDTSHAELPQPAGDVHVDLC